MNIDQYTGFDSGNNAPKEPVTPMTEGINPHVPSTEEAVNSQENQSGTPSGVSPREEIHSEPKETIQQDHNTAQAFQSGDENIKEEYPSNNPELSPQNEELLRIWEAEGRAQQTPDENTQQPVSEQPIQDTGTSGENLDPNSELSPMEQVRQYSPTNDEITPTQEVPENENPTKNIQELQDQVSYLKNIVSIFLKKADIKDFSKLQADPKFPEFNNSGRKMIFPFGQENETILGLKEFKKALNNPIPFDNENQIVIYQSGRTFENGNTPEPLYLKSNSEQIETWKSAIANYENSQSSMTQIQQEPVPATV